MKGVKKYISRNWLWIVVGVILTEVSVRIAYDERGYLAYGGEWLILPLILLVLEIVRITADTVRNLAEMEDEY